MRQIFSVRFFAAVGGVVGLFFLLTTIFATRDVIVGGDGDSDGFELHRIDFVEQVFSSTNESFALTIDGLAANDTDLVIDESRRLRIVEDTPGVNLCPRFPAVGACAVLADLLGEGVVWFALVPAGSNRTVDLPAIDTLDDGLATLVNGWQVPFAPVLDRRCGDEEFTSYREFRDELGDDFTSIFGLDDRRLIAVECRTRVDYAPEPGVETGATTDPDTDPDTTSETTLAPRGSATIPVSVPAPSADAETVDAVQSLSSSIDAALRGVPVDVAVETLTAAGWVTLAIDLDGAEVTLPPIFLPDRVVVRHQDGIVVGATVG